MVSGIPIAVWVEERIRFSEMEIVERVRVKMARDKCSEWDEINGWDVNVAECGQVSRSTLGITRTAVSYLDTPAYRFPV